jgi:ABC-type transport system involved in cytochrome bd biosynthesis fused ATPase/permease subunit
MHRRLISLAKSIPVPLIVTIAASFLAGILTIGQAWTLSRVINDVFLNQLVLEDVWPAMQLLLSIMAGRALLSWVSDFAAGAVAIRVKNRSAREIVCSSIQAWSRLRTRRTDRGIICHSGRRS